MKRSILAIIVVVVAVIVIASAVVIYDNNNKKSTPNTLVVEEAEYPDSLDPAVTFTTPGWEILDQVYQGLVAPNGTSETTFLPVLATNWNVSSNGMNYTFYLRHNVSFTNGDPFNAYVMWFSLYRGMLINQAPEFILGQNMATNNTAGNNTFNVTASTLNGINYKNPSSASLATMENPNQSVQVVNQYEIVAHLGYGYNGFLPYNAFLMTLTTPMGMAVDPSVVLDHGGVVAGATNQYMSGNAIGTGFYKISSIVPQQSITLVVNPNYWGNNLSASQLNEAISPPHIKYIVIEYKPTSAIISDLKGGKAQIVEAPVTDYSTLKNITGITVNKLPIQFGSSQNSFFVYMDQISNYSFQNIDVRKAVTYAINYTGIINSVYGGYAEQWIGPVPPGFTYYNQTISNLAFYSYNPAKAADYLHSAGYRAVLPNGTVLPGNSFPKYNFLYESDSTSQSSAAQIIAQNLQAIGINVTLSGLPGSTYTAIVYGYATNTTQYPIGLNYYTEDYSASIDYVSALADGYYNGTSDYYNSTVFNWTVNASTSFSDQAIIQNLSYITNEMYQNYTMAWLYVPYFLSINANDVTGMIPNTAGSGAGYFMYYNTVQYTS
jgi:peptide/nickel transport system substrate-binding protein